MFIPRYWFKISAKAVTPEGEEIPFELWRGSVESPADAERQATAAAERMADRIRRGHGFPQSYAYADRPVREEIIREIRGETDRPPLAVITRNTYGSLVLNTDQVGFIDVDLPPKGGIRSLWRSLARILFRQPTQPQSDEVIEALERLKKWITTHPEWGVRIYRTRLGLRYLITHAPLVPTDPLSEAAMEALGADPYYRRLCQGQKSFRARLTPKPWRCGVEPVPHRFPWETAEIEQAMRAWEKQYHEAAKPYATCSFLGVIGAADIHPLVAPIVELHDQMTRVSEQLPLA